MLEKAHKMERMLHNGFPEDPDRSGELQRKIHKRSKKMSVAQLEESCSIDDADFSERFPR